ASVVFKIGVVFCGAREFQHVIECLERHDVFGLKTEALRVDLSLKCAVFVPARWRQPMALEALMAEKLDPSLALQPAKHCQVPLPGLGLSLFADVAVSADVVAGWVFGRRVAVEVFMTAGAAAAHPRRAINQRPEGIRLTAALRARHGFVQNYF